ncbi:hypothetical protein L083_5966 [Actinoplanes sp. N902-109]|nr:hypothetical protein L083_5966 [Actinoplanes sp. N902-109]
MCPAQLLAVGQFDVSDRPGRDNPYDRERGYRVNTSTGAPVCVHPFRVGLPPGDYCSSNEPVPATPEEPPAPTRHALDLPSEEDDLEAWIIAVVRAAGPHRLDRALAAAEALAGERFGERATVTAMRRVLTVELVRQHPSRIS